MVLVAPAISIFDKNIDNKGILIQGVQDDLVDPDVNKNGRKSNLNLHLISTSGHFFHNHLGVLKNINKLFKND